jgi:hypothetical protein
MPFGRPAVTGWLGRDTGNPRATGARGAGHPNPRHTMRIDHGPKGLGARLPKNGAMAPATGYPPGSGHRAAGCLESGYRTVQ